MRADNRGVVNALRRAVHEEDWPMANFISDTIVEHLDRLDALEAGEPVPPPTRLEAAEGDAR